MKVHAETKGLHEPLVGGSEGATVVVEPILTGEMQAPQAFVERAQGRLYKLRALGLGSRRASWWWLPVPAFLVRHPTAGLILVDTGFHPSVATDPKQNLGRAWARFVRPRMEQGQDVPAQLRARGLDAREVSVVVMTHLHEDHASAISEFPASTFIVSETEWEAATTDRRPALRRYRPAHYDYVFDYRTIDYTRAGVGSYASFGRTFDLFGDGSIVLAYTPGHSAGHQSVICKLRQRDFVIAGDAIYTFRQLEDGPPQPRPLDEHNWRRSLQELRIFHREYPHAVIVPGHDPAFWPQLDERYED
jgi:N-acyl homoserine lactone hydrolase